MIFTVARPLTRCLLLMFSTWDLIFSGVGIFSYSLGFLDLNSWPSAPVPQQRLVSAQPSLFLMIIYFRLCFQLAPGFLEKLGFLFSNPYLYLHGIFLTLTHLFLVQAPTQYGSVAEFPIHRSVFDGWLHPRFFSLSECGPSHTNRPSVMLLYSALLIFSKYYVCA